MIKSSWINILFTISVFLSFPLILFAQHGLGGMHHHGDFPPLMKHKGKMRETLHTVMLIEMIKYVGLSNEQALEVFPILDEITEMKENHRKNQQETMKELETLVEEKDADEKQIKLIMEKLKKQERVFRDTELELHEKLLTDLTPVQQAKMVIFQAHFREKMMRIMRQARLMQIDESIEKAQKSIEKAQKKIEEFNKKPKDEIEFTEEENLPPAKNFEDILP